MIQNIEQNVPSQVKNLFYNLIPFGSDYVIYTKSYNTQNQVYECLIRLPVSHDLQVYQVSHVAGGSYSLSEVSTNGGNFDSLDVYSPYYSFSNIYGNGIREVLPLSYDITSFMLIVIASLLVLRTVFGGIKLWSNRKKPTA